MSSKTRKKKKTTNILILKDLSNRMRWKVHIAWCIVREENLKLHGAARTKEKMNNFRQLQIYIYDFTCCSFIVAWSANICPKNAHSLNQKAIHARNNTFFHQVFFCVLISSWFTIWKDQGPCVITLLCKFHLKRAPSVYSSNGFNLCVVKKYEEKKKN